MKGTKLKDICEVGEAIEASPSMSADKAELTEEQILGLIWSYLLPGVVRNATPSFMNDFVSQALRVPDYALSLYKWDKPPNAALTCVCIRDINLSSATESYRFKFEFKRTKH